MNVYTPQQDEFGQRVRAKTRIMNPYVDATPKWKKVTDATLHDFLPFGADRVDSAQPTHAPHSFGAMKSSYMLGLLD